MQRENSNAADDGRASAKSMLLKNTQFIIWAARDGVKRKTHFSVSNMGWGLIWCAHRVEPGSCGAQSVKHFISIRMQRAQIKGNCAVLISSCSLKFKSAASHFQQ
jgi:hypothetical protein